MKPNAVRDLSTASPPTTSRPGHKEEAEVRGQEEQELVQKHQPLPEVRNRLGCGTAWCERKQSRCETMLGHSYYMWADNACDVILQIQCRISLITYNHY
jgi:hypothetical protein